jgi:hypothetical protein
MKTPPVIPAAQAAILTLAEIKAAVEAFEDGETNVLDTLDAIVVAVADYLAATEPKRKTA